MPVIFTRQSSERTRILRKAFKRHHVAERFLRRLYEMGALDHIRHRINIERLIRGKVPRGFDIHHIIPLSGGGNNSLNNLCLIEHSLHKFINRYCFDPALKDIQEGETVVIDVPDFPPVALHREYMTFIIETLKKRNKEKRFHHVLLAPLKKLPKFTYWRK